MSEPLGRDRFSTLPQAEVDATREKWEELTLLAASVLTPWAALRKK